MGYDVNLTRAQPSDEGHKSFTHGRDANTRLKLNRGLC
jgi:hypothetical protein